MIKSSSHKVTPKTINHPPSIHFTTNKHFLEDIFLLYAFLSNAKYSKFFHTIFGRSIWIIQKKQAKCHWYIKISLMFIWLKFLIFLLHVFLKLACNFCVSRASKRQQHLVAFPSLSPQIFLTLLFYLFQTPHLHNSCLDYGLGNV